MWATEALVAAREQDFLSTCMQTQLTTELNQKACPTLDTPGKNAFVRTWQLKGEGGGDCSKKVYYRELMIFEWKRTTHVKLLIGVGKLWRWVEAGVRGEGLPCLQRIRDANLMTSMQLQSYRWTQRTKWWSHQWSGTCQGRYPRSAACLFTMGTPSLALLKTGDL